MKFTTRLGSIVILLVVMISIGLSHAKVSEPILTWQVKKGDRIKLIYTKFFFEGQTAMNSTVWNENEEPINVTITTGTTLEFVITYLNTSVEYPEVKGKSIINGEVTTKETSWHQSNPNVIIAQTIDNKTYWEEWCRHKNSEMNLETYRIEGDLLVYDLDTEGEKSNLAVKFLLKRNWKTGWLIYQYMQGWRVNEMIEEFEIVAEEYLASMSETTTLGTISLAFGFFFAVIISYRHQTRKERYISGDFNNPSTSL